MILQNLINRLIILAINSILKNRLAGDNLVMYT